jgi:predicted patatin/cPLA2 family phospholipase
VTVHPEQRTGDRAAPDLPGDDEVMRALLRRRDSGSRPGERDDGHTIALVVSGGGMRGAYAGGMVHALDEAGLRDGFDVVYGSSAGAFVGAGLLLGDGHGSARIFSEDMACRAFIDPWRLRYLCLGRHKPMISLDHLLEHILVESKPMAWDRLRDSPVPLRVIATDADDLQPHVLEDLHTIEDWQRALRATAAIPVLAGGPVELHGRRWIDGSVSEPLPVLRALEDGATHVLALLTRTVPELREADPDARPTLWARALNRLAPGLGAIAHDVQRHGPVLEVLDDAEHPSRNGAHLLAVTPADGHNLSGLCIDVEQVERAAGAGYEAVNAALRRAQGGC